MGIKHKMAHIRREGAMSMQQSSTNSSMSSSQQSSSYSSNVNRASSSSTTAQYADSRGHAASGEVQNGQRYYVEDNFGGRKYIDAPPQQANQHSNRSLKRLTVPKRTMSGLLVENYFT